MLWHTEQCATRSFTVTIAWVRRSTLSRGLLSRWKARRCGFLAPMRGSRWSSATSAWSDSGRAIEEGGALRNLLEAGQAHAAEQAAHLLLHLLVDLLLRVDERGDYHVLQDLDVVLVDDFGIDRQRLHLLQPVDDDGDRAAAGCAFGARLGRLLLHLVLHLGGLLHHLLDVHSFTSSTSRMSAGNTSSSAWTAGSASTAALSRSFSACAVGAATDGPLSTRQETTIGRPARLVASSLSPGRRASKRPAISLGCDS